jgi:hypothetical protein
MEQEAGASLVVAELGDENGQTRSGAGQAQNEGSERERNRGRRRWGMGGG